MSIASEYFDAYVDFSTKQTKLFDAILVAVGLGPVKGYVKRLPFKDWRFDYYDTSFEFRQTELGWIPTDEQFAALWDLGLSRCWVVYQDGSEVYRSQSH